jgi:hypothetical protein
MAATNFTPISLYYSTTASAVPTSGNLVAGELALNITDEKLYFKNAAGTVKLLASNAATVAGVASFSAGTTGFTPNTATTGAVTLAGTLATTNGGTGLTSFTSGGVVYASSTSALATGSVLQFNGSNLGLGVSASAWNTGYKAFVAGGTNGNDQVGGIASGSGLTVVSTNYYRSTTPDEVYAGTGFAMKYLQTSGAHQWFTAPSGTAGNSITFTEVMSISAAGVISDQNGKLRAVPQSGSSKTSSYTLATTDVGEYILLGASGAIVIPDATFAAGDVVSIFNNTGSTATITCSITTAYIAGTFTDKATMTLAAAGVATVLFISGTLCVVSGNVT